jgi:hypothetical protein
MAILSLNQTLPVRETLMSSITIDGPAQDLLHDARVMKAYLG